MGASVDDQVGHRSFGGRMWFELVLGRGSENVHHGCTIGRAWGADHDDPARRAEARQTWRRWCKLAEVALDIEDGLASLADLDAAFAALTYAPQGGPWPGVSPAGWWATLGQEDRAGFARALADAALGARVSA